jgi:hypothetical protein
MSADDHGDRMALRLLHLRDALDALAGLPALDLARPGCVAALGELEHHARRLAVCSGFVAGAPSDTEVT